MSPVEKTLPFAAWMLLWVATLAAQGFATWSVFSHFAAGDYVVPVLATLAVTQLMKIPLAILRLRAMGRPTDDAILAIVPIGNLGLAQQLVQAGEVSAEKRARAEAAWAGELSAIAAFQHGISVVARAIPQVLLLCVAAAVFATAVNELFMTKWLELPARLPTGDPWVQGAMIGTAALAIYTAFQFVKYDRSTRESWIPTVFLIPMVILTAALSFRGMRGMDQQIRLGASFAPTLVVMSIRGGFLAAGFIGLHVAAKEGKLGLAHFGDFISNTLKRGPSLIGAHAAVVHAVTIGIQVVIPGIFYSVVYSLVEPAAYFEPQARSLARSQELTTGIRRRIFKILALSLMLSTIPFGVYAVMTQDPAKLAGAVIDPTTLDWKFWLVWDVLELIATAVSTVAFAAVYEERRQLFADRAAPAEPAATT
jgi:hypothetical protein